MQQPQLQKPPKPKRPVGGPFRYRPGVYDELGSHDHPPEPGVPPRIEAWIVGEDGEIHWFTVATLTDMSYRVPPNRDIWLDDGVRYAGDVDATGRLLAASWKLYDAASYVRKRLARARTAGATPLTPEQLLELENMLIEALDVADGRQS